MGKELPLGYIECEYIYTDGTQYIDTGFIPSSETRAVLDIEPTADVVLGSGTAGVFGSRGNGTTSTINYFAIMANKSSQYRSDFGRDTSVLITVSPFQQRVTIDKNRNVVTINGESASVAWSSWTGLYPIYIFRVNNNGSPTSAQFFGKLYKCQLYNNGTLERDYVPCVNNEGVYGLWDKVYGVFVTSADPTHPLTGKWASPKTLAVSLSEIRRRMLAAIAPKGLIAVPDNEIWYTSTDGNVVKPYFSYIDSFGKDAESNTYTDKGVIKFEGTVTEIYNQAFNRKTTLESITIPNSVTSIGQSAFAGCTSLVSIVLPNQITLISALTFDGCGALGSVPMPDSVTVIGNYAFRDCSSLTEVTISPNVYDIGQQAFRRCTSLTEITIPASVSRIATRALANCSNLAKIVCLRATPPTGADYMFDYIASNAKIYVPAGSGAAYKSASYWSNYANMIVEM